MPSVTPDRISLPDRYRVVKHLANGGMASVWEAHDELLDRDVAVKLLAPHLGEDERARRRFQREARAAAGLSSHPNVVTIYDVGEHKNRVFMVMEIMRGGSVADRLRSGREIPHATAIRWLREAAGALDTAHDAGVVHRDIKPANLLLDGHDRLAVADFGIARLAWEDQLTATGQVLGTAAYLSPEQAMGEAATAASDRYALAVVAYELLTGTRPFEAEHFAAQARAHVEDPVPAASVRGDGLSTAVDAVLERGLAKNPGDRWESSAAFVDALERTVGEQREPTKPTRRLSGRRQKAAAAVVDGPAPAPRPPVSDGGPPAPPPQRARRSGAPLLIALIALVVLAGAGIFALANRDNGSSGGENSRAQSTPEATATPSPKPHKSPKPTPTASPKPTDTPTQAPTETPTQAPTDTPTPKATHTATPSAPSTSPATLEARGHSQLLSGDTQGAVTTLKAAVDACGGSTQVDPCAYAMYDYADALVRAGRANEAIPVLQARLARFDNQNGTVRALLKKAQREAQ
jgi:serine/threonine protein kinase